MGNNQTNPRIAINAHLLAAEQSYRSAGLSMYIDQLVRHLGEASWPALYDVYVGKGVGIDAKVRKIYQSRMITQSPVKRILWEQMVLPWHLLRGRYDLLHALAFVGPLLSPCPQVLSVHDLSFLRLPQFFRKSNRFYLSLLTKVSARRARKVITISKFSADEIHELLGIPKSRIKVTYLGLDARFKPLEAATIAAFRQEKDLPEKYILFLGTLEPRKNLIRLVQAYARSGIRDMPLVLAGGQGWYYQDVYAEVEKLGLQNFVRFTGYVPSPELAFWYNAAWALAYVSTYEGFGLPALEALACGVPVLASSTTSLPEATGGHAVSVDPHNVDAIADGLRRVVYDKALREQNIGCGLAYASQFTWEKTAKETQAVYLSALQAGSTNNSEGI